MMEYLIKIKGRSKPYYDVSLCDNKKNITITCTCPAGELGLLCHHKADLLSGDISILYDSAEVETLNKVTSLIKKTNYQKLMQEYTQIKKDIEKLIKHEKDFRKMLERTLQNGLKINNAD